MESIIVNKIYNRYSLKDKIYLLIRLLYSKFFFPGTRLIRSGFSIRGREFIDFGEKLTTGYNCRIEAFATNENTGKKIFFGTNVQLNDYVHISAISSVSIGDNALIASHVYISDNSHGCYRGNNEDTSPEISPIKRPYYVAPVKIGSNVWIGEGVIILPGVKIGDGAIIGAHSIVRSNIPDNCIAVGTPAKVKKKWDNTTQRWIKIC